MKTLQYLRYESTTLKPLQSICYQINLNKTLLLAELSATALNTANKIYVA